MLRAHGIAGARVDRIAKAAAGNKNLIYLYFGSKERLFAAVLARHLSHVYDAVAFTPEDLPNYAARLCDFVLDHPALTRLLLWFGLEQGNEQWGVWDVEPEGAVEAKLKGITEAQLERAVTADFTPAFLLTTVIALSSAWTAANPLHQFIDPGALTRCAQLREKVAEAVARLTQP